MLVNYDRLFHDLIVKSCRDRLLENNFVREELNINIIEELEKELQDEDFEEFNEFLEEEEENDLETALKEMGLNE